MSQHIRGRNAHPNAHGGEPDNAGRTKSAGSGHKVLSIVVAAIVAIVVGGFAFAGITASAGAATVLPDINVSTTVGTLVTVPIPEATGDVTITNVSPPSASFGLAGINGSSINFMPDFTYTGQLSFTYTLSDGDTGKVNVTVNPKVVKPSVLMSWSDSDHLTSGQCEDILWTSQNATTLTATGDLPGWTQSPSKSVPGGSQQICPVVSVTTTYTATITTNTNSAGNDSSTLTLTVDPAAPANHAPVAGNDSATTPENTAIYVDVLSKASDADGDTLNIVVASLGTPANGTAQVSNNQILYTPQNGFSGTDSVTFQVSDGKADSNVATLSLTVSPVVTPPPNQAPVAKLSVTPTSGNAPLAISADASASTDDKAVVTYDFVWGDGTSTGFQASATATHTLANAGSDTVSVTVKDAEGLTDSATQAVTVNAVTPPPPTTKVVHVDAKSLKQDCSSGKDCTAGAVFTLTKVGKDRPASISVKLSDGSSATATLQGVKNDTATYSVSFKNGLHVTDASATVDKDFCGEFKLDHYICKTIVVPPPAQPAAPTATLNFEGCVVPGVTTDVTTIIVNNTADDTHQAVTYSYSVTNVNTTALVTSGTFGSVADGATGSVQLTGIQPGFYSVNIGGSDKTTVSFEFTMQTCAPQQTVTPTPAPTTGGTPAQPVAAATDGHGISFGWTGGMIAGLVALIALGGIWFQRGRRAHRAQ
ncbi:MAG: Ig-like domain-containing protein [Candidatus Saccharibacteria bacterium]